MTGSSKPDLSTDKLGAQGDEFYATLIKAHDGLSDEQSAMLNAKLVLLLANQVGDLATLQSAIERAKTGI